MKLKTADYKRDIFYLMNKYSGTISIVEAEMLLEYLFNCARLDLYVKDFVVTDTIEELHDFLIERRLSGDPVQYITGHAEFMGMDFIVTKDTFIPRPETELLVNEIINSSRLVRLRRDSLEHYWNDRVSSQQYSSSGHDNISREQSREVKILDLCTGSGNIAVTLAKLMPQVEITAVDISEAALKIAEKNAERHDVSDKVKFYKGNAFNALVFDINPKFDIIVCNPPYIKDEEAPFLQKEVTREPAVALNGGKDGLGFYRVIAKEAHRYLEKGGSVLLEMGFGQKQAVEDIFSSSNIFEIYKIIRDFSGIERAIWINLL